MRAALWGFVGLGLEGGPATQSLSGSSSPLPPRDRACPAGSRRRGKSVSPFKEKPVERWRDAGGFAGLRISRLAG